MTHLTPQEQIQLLLALAVFAYWINFHAHELTLSMYCYKQKERMDRLMQFPTYKRAIYWLLAPILVPLHATAKLLAPTFKRRAK